MIRLNPAVARPTEVVEMDWAAKGAESFFARRRDACPLFELFEGGARLIAPVWP